MIGIGNFLPKVFWILFGANLMPISINCCCGKKFMVEDELAGQQAQCQCGNVFTVPKTYAVPIRDELVKLDFNVLIQGFRGKT